VCGSSSLTHVIDLGKQYLQGSFVKGENTPPMRQIPTSLVRCDPMKDEHACGLLQMEYTVPPSILYSVYWYRSGTNETMRNHLQGIANQALQLFGKQKACVLDIGCNDGTLLNFYPDSFERFGVDPSDIVRGITGNLHVVQDIFPSEELAKKMQGKTADLITSIAMFYDLEDPVSFMRAVKKTLSQDGLWIFEMSYMPSMLELNSYDTICHEHLEYYSLAVIEYMLKLAGLKIVNVELNTINGGSIRCFATHTDCFQYMKPVFTENVNALRRQEFDLELDTDKPYVHFQERIEKHRKELNALLKKMKKEGKSIHIYGASTKGNTILQWCGIDHSIIDVAAERNPDKYGAKTLGTDIPIVSEEESRRMNPDFYLVLPWHFREEFVQREREQLAKGIGYIFPLPEIEIVKG